MWRRILDRNRHKAAVAAQRGISGVWTTFQGLSAAGRGVAERLAAEAVNWHSERLDLPVMTYDTIYRLAVITPTAALDRACALQVTASRGFEAMNDVARWVVPTLIQFCYMGELMRR